MSINIEAFKKNKDLICVNNKLYTMEEYIARVDILEAQVEELKAKNERLRIRIKELERISKVQHKEENHCEYVGEFIDGCGLAEEDYDCVVIDGKHRWEIDEDEELEELEEEEET